MITEDSPKTVTKTRYPLDDPRRPYLTQRIMIYALYKSLHNNVDYIYISEVMEHFNTSHEVAYILLESLAHSGNLNVSRRNETSHRNMYYINSHGRRYAQYLWDNAPKYKLDVTLYEVDLLLSDKY